MTLDRAVAVMAVALVLLATPSKPLIAQTLRVSLEELTRTSDVVVMGHTTRMESYWNDDRSAILTRVTIRVDDALYGSPGATQTVIVPGGQVGDLLHEVSDTPVFVENEDVVVFLTRHQSGLTIVNGGVQGKLDVLTDTETGEKTVRGFSHLVHDDSEVASKAGEPRDLLDSEEAEVSVPLTELVRKVKALR